MAYIVRQAVALHTSRLTGIAEETLLHLIQPVLGKGRHPVLSIPLKSLQHHLSLNLSTPCEKDNQKDLQEFGKSIAAKITCPQHVENITIDKKSILFKVCLPDLAKTILQNVQSSQKQYGFLPKPWEKRQQKKIIVEYSSPNIAKPFHAGHLRSTLIGHFIANLHVELGHDVTTMNYLGDWGVQFGLLSIGFQKYGSEVELTNCPIKHLFDIYVRMNQEAEKDSSIMDQARGFFSRMEKGDETCLSLWRRFRELSIHDYTKTYQRLGISFDSYLSESAYGDRSQQLLQRLESVGLLETSPKGTKVVNIADLYPQMPYATLAKSDGSSLYLTRDVAAAIHRKELFNFDEMYYVVDKSQSNHLIQLTSVLKKMGHDWADSIFHVKFGRVKGMKTRKGDVVFLQDILDEAKNRMAESRKEHHTSRGDGSPDDVAEQLGLTTLVLQEASRTLTSDYTFDWDHVLKSHGDCLLQYTHARLKSIEKNSGLLVNQDASIEGTLLDANSQLLLWQLANLDSAVDQSYQAMQPKYVTAYLHHLCHLTSHAIKSLRVQGSDRPTAEAHLLLFDSTRIAVANGLRLLGITPLAQM